MTDFIFNIIIIIACFILCSCYCFVFSLLSTIFQRDKCVCVTLCGCLCCVCMNVLCNLVRFVAAWGSLLCECMPVLHFLPFVFETLKPVFESLSARIDAQLHSTCKQRSRDRQEASEEDGKIVEGL